MKAYVRGEWRRGRWGSPQRTLLRPGDYATTEEVIELGTALAAEYPGAQSTTPTTGDPGGVVYPPSATWIGQGSASRGGGDEGHLSHFNPQGAHNYGRANEGAALIREARARGVDVRGGPACLHRPPSPTSRSYTIPGLGPAPGGQRHWAALSTTRTRWGSSPPRARRCWPSRGGAENSFLVDPRPHLNATRLRWSEEWGGLPAPEASRRIPRGRGISPS